MQTGRQLSRSAFFTAAVFEGSLVGVAYLLGLMTGISPFEKWTLTGDAVLVGLAAAVPPLVVFVVFVRWPVGPLRSIRDTLDESFVPIFGHCTWDELLALAMLAGVGEEMLFRGVVQGSIEAWTGPLIGLLAASVLFGLAHLVTPTYAILAGAIGLYLGWLLQWTESLVAPAVTHAVYDFVAFLVLMRRRPSEGTPIGGDPAG